MDRIALAIAVEGTRSHQYSDRIRRIARASRASIVKSAILEVQGERRIGLWIIHTDPSPKDRQMYRAVNARIVEMDPGKEVCLTRLKSRPKENQKIAESVIRNYYQVRSSRVASSMADTGPTKSD